MNETINTKYFAGLIAIIMLLAFASPAFAIRATSCDADPTCEANNVKVKGNTQTNDLTANQASIATAFINSLTANKLIAAQARITTAFINFLTATQATIGKILIAGNSISTALDSDLLLQPATKKVIVNNDITASSFITKGSITSTGLNITGNRISNNQTTSTASTANILIDSVINRPTEIKLQVYNSSGAKYAHMTVTSDNGIIGYTMKDINFTASRISLITPKIVTSLTGPGSAYVCVDSTGTLYRSLVPCV